MADHIQSNKIFVYGIWKISIEDVKRYFENIGPVKKIEVLRDQEYAFVEFFDGSSVRRALEVEEQYIGNQRIIVKKAFARGIKRQNSQNSNYSASNAIFAYAYKIFVGGLPRAISNEEFRSYFEMFGNVIDSIVIRDSSTNVSRGFGFVSFDSPTVMQKLLGYGFLYLNGAIVEVKAAVPRPQHYIAQTPCLYTAAYPPHYPIIANHQTPAYAYDLNWCFPSYGDIDCYFNGYYGYVNPQDFCYFFNASNVVN